MYKSVSDVKRLLLLCLILIEIFFVGGYAQDDVYEFSINQRRRYDQIHAELWVKRFADSPPTLGYVNIFINYNSKYLKIASSQSVATADSLHSEIDQYNPIRNFSSPFNGTNGYGNLVLTEYDTTTAVIKISPDGGGTTGYRVSEDGRGTFVGKVIFDIVNGPRPVDLSEMLINESLSIVEDPVHNSMMDLNIIKLTDPDEFSIIGVTLLSGVSIGNVIDRNKDYKCLEYYNDQIQTNSVYKGAGYPIFYEHSVNPQEYIGAVDVGISWIIDRSTDGGRSWEEIGRFAETNTKSTSVDGSLISGEIAKDINGKNNTYIMTSWKNEKINSQNYRQPRRTIWESTTDNKTRLITMRLRIGGLADTNVAIKNKNTISKIFASEFEMPMGSFFFTNLAGGTQYYRTDTTFSNATQLSVSAWINPAAQRLGDVGIVVSSGGVDASEFKGSKEGAWMLYLDKGQYPAFRARENNNNGEDGYLTKIIATDPIKFSGYSDEADYHSLNWTHIAAVLKDNKAWLYVDGELAGSSVNDSAKGAARLLQTDHHVYVGLNPNFAFDVSNLFSGGIKEVQVWKRALSQDQIKAFAAGFQKADEFSGDDPKVALELYYPLQGDPEDYAREEEDQEGRNDLKYFEDAIPKYKPGFEPMWPDIPHARIVSPTMGSGLTNQMGDEFEIRYISYGLGDNNRDDSKDIEIEYSVDSGTSWHLVEDPEGVDFGGTKAPDIEPGRVMWEPFNNNDDFANLRDAKPFGKSALLRISGHGDYFQENILSISQGFSISKFFSINKTREISIYVDEADEFTVPEDGLFLEAWIRPHEFPFDGERIFPIVAKGDSVSGQIDYLFALNNFGQLELITIDSEENQYRAVSSNEYKVQEPLSKDIDSAWTHVAVYFNPKLAQSDRVKFYIDAREVSTDTNFTLVDEAIFDPIEDSPMFIGYLPELGEQGGSRGFFGQLREIRLWNGLPFEYNYDKEGLDSVQTFLQGASALHVDKFQDTSRINLITSFSFNGGVYSYGGGKRRIVSAFDSTIFAHWAGDSLEYMPTKPYLRIVEPVAETEGLQDDEIFKIRWTGFDYDEEGFDSGLYKKTPPSIEFSPFGGGVGGPDNIPPYQFVGSRFWNITFADAFNVPDNRNYRFTEHGGEHFYAGNLNLSIVNPDLNGDGATTDQGPIPYARENARLRLTGRFTIEGESESIESESELFTVWPEANFTLRLLLEGKHQGYRLPLKQIETEYDKGGVRIHLYKDNNGEVGEEVEVTEAVRPYLERDPINLNDRNNRFANMDFLFTELADGKYWVMVEQHNHLPVLTRYPAQFFFDGDERTTWAVESGWDFSSWNGEFGNFLPNSETDPTTGGYYTAFGKASSTMSDEEWVQTGLTFNDGVWNSSNTPLPAMVAGDVNQDGKINDEDFNFIISKSATNNIVANLNSDSYVNSADRVMCLRNIGREHSLGKFGYLLYGTGDIADDNNSKSLKSSIALKPEDCHFCEGSNLIGKDTLLGEIPAYAGMTDVFLKKKNKISNERSSHSGIEYLISSETKVEADQITIEIFIQNVGDAFALGNTTIGLSYEDTFVEYDSYSDAGVVFSNKPSLGYETAFSGPISGTDEMKNLRTIEIVYDPSQGDGLEVPEARTSLGKLKFNVLDYDKVVSFDWNSSTRVFTTAGDDVTLLGERDDIENLKLYQVNFIYPKGKEIFARNQTIIVEWLNEGPDVYIDFKSEEAFLTERISPNSFSSSITTFVYNLPDINCEDCHFRMIDKETDKLIEKSKIFSILDRSAIITSPSYRDGVFSGGEESVITFLANGIKKGNFEYSVNGGLWKEIESDVDLAKTSLEWTLPEVTTARAYVRLTDTGGFPIAVSDSFKIMNGELNFKGGASGEEFEGGDPRTILWYYEQVDFFDLQFSSNGGSDWSDIERDVSAAPRYYEWTVPNVATNSAVIRALHRGDDDLEYDRTPIFSINPTSVVDKQLFHSGKLKVFPKRSKTESGTIVVETTRSQTASVVVYSLDGREVLTHNQMLRSGYNEVSLNGFESLSNNPYLIIVSQGTNVASVLLYKY
jgi:Concanavalin A-like lectin/glucanases superfamily